MSELASSFVWAAIQVLLFSTFVFAVVLFSRKWISGVIGELLFVSLAVIILVPILSLLPVPGWLPSGNDVVASRASIIEEESRSATTKPRQATEQPVTPPLSDINLLDQSEKDIANLASGEEPQFTTSLTSNLHHWWNEFRSTPAAESTTTARHRFPWVTLTFYLLAAIALLGLVRLTIGIYSLVGLKKRSREIFEPEILNAVSALQEQMEISKPITVYETQELTTAATIGWRKATVLLPVDWREWSREEQASALSHELAHVQNNDFIKNLVSQFAVALNFFNPIVHWLGQELRVSQELGADAKAAVASGGRSTYLLTMAEMAIKQDNNQLGWLAQPFLPTRKTFLRRIEMLKSKKKLRGSRSGFALWTARLAVAAIALVCIGFRIPAQDTGRTEGEVVNSVSTVAAEHNQLAYISNRAEGFLAVNLSAFSDLEFREDLVAIFNPLAHLEVGLEDVDSISVQLIDLEGKIGERSGGIPHDGLGTVIRSRETWNLDLTNATKFTYRGLQCFQMEGLYCHLPNERTLVTALSKPILERMLDAGPNGESHSDWLDKAQAHSASPIVVGISQLGMEAISRIEGGSPTTKPRSRQNSASSFSPLWNDSIYSVGGLKLESGLLQLTSDLASVDEKRAERVVNTIEAWKLITLNQLESAKENFTDPENPMNQAIDLGLSLLNKSVIEKVDSTISITAAAPIDEMMITRIAKSMSQSVTKQKERVDGLNRLRQAALAMHNYADSHRSEDGKSRFPNSSMKKKGSRFEHSWRIALLPYLEELEMYNNYRFEEAWNSPHNRKVTAKMPEAFRHPSQDPDDTTSSIYMVTGPGTVFPADSPLALQDIPDGTANTLLLVQAKRDTHWADPSDIPFDETNILEQIGGFSDDYTAIAMCDASVHLFGGLAHPIGDEKSKNLLKSIILASDGLTPALSPMAPPTGR